MGSSRRWRAWLTEAARAELARSASGAHPRETGGILVGVHTSGSRPWIVHAVEIPSTNSGNAHYVVPPRHRGRVVERLRRHHDPRLGYLGEWHSHPLDVSASDTDLDSMRRIAGDPTAGSPRPVLLVARRVSTGYELDAVQIDKKSVRQLDLIPAGPLGGATGGVETKRSRRLLSTVMRR